MAVTQSSILRNLALTCIGIGAIGSSCSVYTKELLLPGSGGASAIGGTQNAVGSASGAGGYSPLGSGGVANLSAAGNTLSTAPSALAGASGNAGASAVFGGSTPGGVSGRGASGGGATASGGLAQGGSSSPRGGSSNSAQGGQTGGGGSMSSNSSGGRSAAAGAATAVDTAGKSASGGSGVGGGSSGGATSSTIGTGTAGRAAIGGAGSGGSVAGTAGRATYARGGAAGGTGCEFDPTLVDDMHSADTAILLCSGRAGHWYKFGADEALTFGKVATDPTDAAILGTKYEAKLTGASTQLGDCGMGFPLAESGTTKSPYVLTGMRITFPYRTTGLSARALLSLAVPILATTPTDQGGTCTGTDCSNHYSHTLPSTEGVWLLADVPFVAGGSGFSQNVSWGKGLVDWLPDTALMIQFTLQGQESNPYAIEVGTINVRPAQ